MWRRSIPSRILQIVQGDPLNLLSGWWGSAPKLEGDLDILESFRDLIILEPTLYTIDIAAMGL